MVLPNKKHCFSKRHRKHFIAQARPACEGPKMQGSSPPPRCRGGPSPTAGDRRGGPHAHLTRGDSQGVAHALLLDPAGRLDLRVGPGAAVTGEGADDDLFEEGDPGEQEPRHPLQQRGASWEPESSGRRFPAGPVFLPRTLPAVSPSLSPARPPAPPQNTQPPLTCQQALPTPSCPPAATTTPAMAPRPLLPLTRPAGPGAGPGRLPPVPHVAEAVHAQ